MTATLQAIALALACAAAPKAPAVTIHSQPAMAAAFWDGRYVGAAPLTLKSVPPGRHGLKLTRHGYRNWVQLVTVSAAGAAVNAKLVPTASGGLRVESTPDEAQVFLGGEFQGHTPLDLDGLPVGKVELRVEKEEFLPAQVQATVVAGKTSRVKVTLKSKTEAFLLEKIKHDPTRVQNYTELGHFYMMRRDYDRAFAAYAKGMDACVGPKAIPNDRLRLYNELRYCHDGSVVKFVDDEHSDAFKARFVKLYEDAIKRVPANERNYWALAPLRQKAGDWGASIALYEQAIKHARNNRVKHRSMRAAAKALYQYGRSFQKKKQYRQAVEQYEKAIALFPLTYYARSALTSAISVYTYYLKKPDKVNELRRLFIKRFPHDPSAPTYLRQIAQTKLAEGKPKDAVAVYQQLLKQYPQSDLCPEIMRDLAACYCNQLKDDGKALATYLECVKRYPKSEGNAAALLVAAQICNRRKDAAKAKALRAQIVKQYPRSTEAEKVDTDPKRKLARQQAAALFMRAQNAESRDPKAAIKLYEQVVAKYPQTRHGPSALSRIIALNRNKLRDTAAELAARERYVKLYPDSDSARQQLMSLGSRYRKLKQYDKALDANRRFLKLYPDSDSCPTAQYHIGLIYYQNIFDQPKAVAEFRKLLAKWPHHTYAPAALYHIGWSYFLYQKGAADKAIASFRDLLTKYPYESYADSVEYWLDALQKTKPEPAEWWK